MSAIHTSTPWSVNQWSTDETRLYFGVRGDAGLGCTFRGADAEANAAHIVRCVNNHDALVEALRRADAVLFTTSPPPGRVAYFESARDAIAQALAAAGAA